MRKNTVLFRFVPTMRCNFRCNYCFVHETIKENGQTMFDNHSVDEWIDAMKKFRDYNIELYFWGGEPFCIPETYKLLSAWTKMDHVIAGIRIDTNVSYAEKIVNECPSSKLKLNCSYHMQYHTLEEEFSKIKMLKEYDMVGMVNFVASPYNLEHLKKDYGMSVKDLIEKFKEIDVFVNVAGDFAYANNPKYERYEEYRNFILQFVSPEEWTWLRGVKKERLCTAGQKMFTVEHDGTFTSCASKREYGNFFDGVLTPDEMTDSCEKNCQSLVSYPFRTDNNFTCVNSLLAYVERNEIYRANVREEYIEFSF